MIASISMADPQNIRSFQYSFERFTHLTMGTEVEVYLSNGTVAEGEVNKIVWEAEGMYPLALSIMVQLPNASDGQPNRYVRVFNWDHVVEIRPRLQ